MRIEGAAKSVAIFIGESDKWQGKTLDVAIVERAHAEDSPAQPCFMALQALAQPV